MLLNEIKQIFEVDLQGALDGLGIHTHLSGSDGEAKGGDVDAAFQPLVEKYIVTADYQPPAASDLKAFTGPDKYEQLIHSLGNLTGTLAQLQSRFTTALMGQADMLDVIAKAEKKTSAQWIAGNVAQFNDQNSQYFKDQLNAVRETLTANHATLTRTLMKLANAESFGSKSFEQIKNIMNSGKYVDPATKEPPLDAKGQPDMSGVNQVKALLLKFYASVVMMQQNAKKLTFAVTKIAPAPASK